MRTIHKFPLEVTDIQKVSMPRDSTILTVQVQRGIPCLWALVDTDKKHEERLIGVIGTGNPAPKQVIRFIGTFQLSPQGLFVGHVFEIEKI